MKAIDYRQADEFDDIAEETYADIREGSSLDSERHCKRIKIAMSKAAEIVLRESIKQAKKQSDKQEKGMAQLRREIRNLREKCVSHMACEEMHIPKAKKKATKKRSCTKK